MRALILKLAFALALLGTGYAAQDAPERPARQSARERWEAMTPAEQALMRKRFEALEEMQEGRRSELRERHDRWQKSERRSLDRLPKTARDKLEQLPPEKRRELLRELTTEELSTRGRDLLEHLPQEWRERLESARPEDRRRVLDEFRREHRDQGQRSVLDRAERELSLEPAERAAIEALPEAERELRLIKLHARVVRARIQREGLPRWIPEDDWQRVSSLEPHDFLEEVNALRRQAGVPNPGPPGVGPRDRREGQGPAGRGASFMQLRSLARPDPSWRVELSKLTPEQRRVAIETRVRERVTEFLKQHPDVLTAEQRTALEGAHGREFLEELRRAVSTGSSGRPGGPGAHRRPRGTRGEHPQGKRESGQRTPEERTPGQRPARRQPGAPPRH